LLDLIRIVKPRAALFTTFTFSISHFDAVFVPVLRSVGCQDISVLVDANNAARSAEESYSRAAGRVYRIAPVVAPGGGVFHPKFSYLAGDNGDTLSVGSGNLTASGQSLQLESFDSVTASEAPTVFQDLAEAMELLASAIDSTCPQAAQLSRQLALRSLQAYRANADPPGTNALPPPSLIHTLSGTASDAVKAMFLKDAGRAEELTVLSPFHAPDGGPLLRLAQAVNAKSLSVGVNGGTAQLLAPFVRERFKPQLPGRFVLPVTSSDNKRLHAKVFELNAGDKSLVMTGSVNATAQSFESTKNVEVSLARWLPASPFTWKKVEPADYQATQEASDFDSARTLFVDAWIDDVRVLHGKITSKQELPQKVQLVMFSAESSVLETEVEVANDGSFRVWHLPDFDSSHSTRLTITHGQAQACCWLNRHEELDIASEERDRRSAICRVLRGEYAAEDIAEVVRLLSLTAQGMSSVASGRTEYSAAQAKDDDDVPFTFMRWKEDGRLRGGTTLLGGDPHDLLRALNRWMNADLQVSDHNDTTARTASVRSGGVQLQGGTDAELLEATVQTDPYALLDQLCIAIPVALERQRELEYGATLAEVVASRAIDRAFKQDLRMLPCLSWLDRFSRFTYPESAREALCGVAVAMACVTALRLERENSDPQLPSLREAVERFAGGELSAPRWAALCDIGIQRDLFRRVTEAQRQAAEAMSHRLASAMTLDDGLISLLRKAFSVPRQLLAEEPEAAGRQDVATALRERIPKKQDLLRGLLDEKSLARKGTGCPFCYETLGEGVTSALLQHHAAVHKGMRCNRLLLYSERHGRLATGIQELPDA
jgi:hypothetical protein